MRNPIQRKSPTVFPYRGKFRIQYQDLEGRTRTRTADTQVDAYRELARLESEMKLGFSPKSRNEIPTVSEWLDVWLSHRESDVRLTTHMGFEATIRNYLKPLLGTFKLDALSVYEIENAYKTLAEVKDLSPATIRKFHSILTQAFKMALRYGLVHRNPMDSVRTPKVYSVPKQTLSFTEVRKILDQAEFEGVDTHARFLLALRLGMRQGECLALSWADIDLENRQVSITKSVDVLPGKGVVVSPPKSRNSNRTIPLDDETAFALYKLRESHPEAKQESLLFPSVAGKYRNARIDYDNWKALLAKAGVRSVKLHDARHAAATLLLESGADARTIQLLLGHSSPSFTLATYVHPDHNTLRRALERASGVAAGLPNGP